MRGFFAALASFLVILVGNLGCESLQKFEYVQPKMGTGFRVVMYAHDKAIADRAAKAAFERVDQLNAIFSDYDSNSELSKLGQLTNDGPMTKPVAVSPDMWRMLQQAYAASERSDGAFDITVGPFVRLWRRSRDLHELPTTQRLEQTRNSVGWQAMRLFPETHSVQLLKPRMRLDVGGIAKGYTAMECVALMRSFGIRRAMVGAAGDLTVADPPPSRPYWRVAVQSLADPEKSDGYVKIRNASISTSGDTQRFIIIDGQRYSHIIDPRTGRGLTHRIGCTVISPDGTTSDWLCKPACVLGPERGLQLIDRTPGAAGRVVTLDENGGKRIYESARWKQFVVGDGQAAD